MEKTVARSQHGVRGEHQEVQHINGYPTSLHDPLLATPLDYVRRALDQLAHALSLIVSSVYPTINGRKIQGYRKEGKGTNRKAVEPSKDVYYLLTYIDYQSKFYAEHLSQSRSGLKRNVKFLKNHIRNQMAHQTYLNDHESTSAEQRDSKKIETAGKCLKKCAQLLQWFLDATCLKDEDKVEVQKILDNIKNMTYVFQDFKEVKEIVKDTENKGLEIDTDMAMKIWKNIQEELGQESRKPSSIKDRPLTHLINMVWSPRLRELRINEE